MQRTAKFIEAMAAYDNDRTDVARRLMEQAADQGDSVACFTVALWCRDGEGGPVDLKSSKKWMARFEAIAEDGDPEAQWDLGQCYRFGDLFRVDIKRANHWLERAAEAGYGDAQHHLAWYIETGQYNYPEDAEEAAVWYERALAQGHPQTLYMFALRKFENGQPTEEAIRLLALAVEKGFQPAADVLQSYRQ
jgi:uncharacterized protein